MKNKKKTMLATALVATTLLTTTVTTVKADDTKIFQQEKLRDKATFNISVDVKTDKTGLDISGEVTKNSDNLSLKITAVSGVFDSTANTLGNIKDKKFQGSLFLGNNVKDGTYSVKFLLADDTSKTEVSEVKTYWVQVKDSKIVGLSDKKIEEKKEEKPVTTLPSVVRLYNPKDGNHWFTTDANTITSLVSQGWNDEKQAFLSFPSTEIGVSPVYEVTSPTGYYHFTSNEEEIEKLVKIGWKKGTIVFYASNTIIKGTPTTAVHRVYNKNTGTHHFTSNTKEIAGLVAQGWHDEGIAYYVPAS